MSAGDLYFATNATYRFIHSEKRRAGDLAEPPPSLRGPYDARNLSSWKQETHHLCLNSERVDKLS